MQTLEQELSNRGIWERVVGKTPIVWDESPRRRVIRRFLAEWEGEPIDRFVVVDDERDADTGKGTFVKTTWNRGGLTPRAADRIIAKLQ